MQIGGTLSVFLSLFFFDLTTTGIYNEAIKMWLSEVWNLWMSPNADFPFFRCFVRLLLQSPPVAAYLRGFMMSLLSLIREKRLNCIGHRSLIRAFKRISFFCLVLFLQYAFGILSISIVKRTVQSVFKEFVWIWAESRVQCTWKFIRLLPSAFPSVNSNDSVLLADILYMLIP